MIRHTEGKKRLKMKRRLRSIKARYQGLGFWWPFCGFIGLLCFMIITKDPYFQEWATLGLVLVTLMHVILNKSILGEMGRSVTEMRKQRYVGSQPWVFPNLVSDEGKFIDTGKLFFTNFGNGPAIDLKPFISDGDVTRMADEWKRRTGPTDSRRLGPSWIILKAGQSLPWLGAFEAPKTGDAGVIAVEYRDIYEREFLSGWAYRIEEVDRYMATITVTDYLLVPGVPLYPVERQQQL